MPRSVGSDRVTTHQPMRMIRQTPPRSHPQWFSDQNFGTHYQPNNSDTMTDIAANDVGGLVGGLWLAAWATRTRRINRSG
jgi:hypothetical protein